MGQLANTRRAQAHPFLDDGAELLTPAERGAQHNIVGGGERGADLARKLLVHAPAAGRVEEDAAQRDRSGVGTGDDEQEGLAPQILPLQESVLAVLAAGLADKVRQCRGARAGPRPSRAQRVASTSGSRRFLRRNCPRSVSRAGPRG